MKNFVFTGCSKNVDVDELKKLILKLGGEVSSEFQNNSTHLICDTPCRTDKYIAALASGGWILTTDYITESYRAGRFLDESDFEISPADYEQTPESALYDLVNAPRRCRNKVLKSGRKLFSDWEVVLLIKDPKKKASYERVFTSGNASILQPLQLKIFAKGTFKHLRIFVDKDVSSSLLSINEPGLPCYTLFYIRDYLIQESSEIQHYITGKIREEDLLSFSSVNRSTLSLGYPKEIRKKHRLPLTATSKDSHDLSRRKIPPKNEGNTKEMPDELDSLCEIYFEENQEKNAVDILISLTSDRFYPQVKTLNIILFQIFQKTKDKELFADIYNYICNLLMCHPPTTTKMRRYYFKVFVFHRSENELWSVLSDAFHATLEDESFVESNYLLSSFIITTMEQNFQAFADMSGDRKMNIFSSKSCPLIVNMFWPTDNAITVNRRCRELFTCIGKILNCNLTDKKQMVLQLLFRMLSLVAEVFCLSKHKHEMDALNNTELDDLPASILSHVKGTLRSTETLKVFLSSIEPSWLQLKICELLLQKYDTYQMSDCSPLSLRKILCHYLFLIFCPCNECHSQKECGHRKCSKSMKIYETVKEGFGTADNDEMKKSLAKITESLTIDSLGQTSHQNLEAKCERFTMLFTFLLNSYVKISHLLEMSHFFAKNEYKFGDLKASAAKCYLVSVLKREVSLTEIESRMDDLYIASVQEQYVSLYKQLVLKLCGGELSERMEILMLQLDLLTLDIAM